MSRGLRGTRLLGAVLCWAGVVAHAPAQDLGAAGGAQGRELRLGTDIFGGWDASLKSNRGLFADPTEDSLAYGGANLSLAYSRPLSRTSRSLSRTLFSLSLSSSTRYIPQTSTHWLPYYGLAMGLKSGGASRWSWGLSQAVGYGARQATSLFAGSGLDVSSLAYGLPTGAVDYQISNVRDLSSSSRADLGVRLGRRDRISLGAGASTIFTSNGRSDKYVRLSGNTAYGRQLTRNTSLNVGYRYEDSRRLGEQDAVAGGAGRSEIHGIDLGLGYARPLPFSRKTTLSARTGLSGVPQANGKWRYFPVGTGGLTHQFKRTWSAQLDGERSVRFVPAFPDPTVVNGVSASMRGILSGRTSVSTAANYAVGQSGFGGVPTEFEAISGQAQVRYAIFGYAGLYAEYFYFQASVRSVVQQEFPRGEFARHGVRVGASFGTDPGRRQR